MTHTGWIRSFAHLGAMRELIYYPFVDLNE